MPTDILNNLPLIIEQSKLVATNSGNPSDPLYMAYRNFVDELDNYNKRPQVNTLQHNQQETLISQDPIHNKNIGSNNSAVTPLNENKDMNNNKEIEKLKCKLNLLEPVDEFTF